MKIMTLGDLHFAEYKDFSTNVLADWDHEKLRYVESSTGTKMNSRLLNLANALVEAREYCEKNKIYTVLVSGDVSHNRGSVPTVVQNVEYRILESFKLKGIEVIIIAGNHDQVSNEDFPENSLVPFQNISTIIDRPVTITRGKKGDDVQLICVPFSPNKQIVIDAINSTLDTTVASRIILAHLGLTGGVTGKNSYVLTDQYEAEELRYIDEDIDLVVLGHYHKPQVVPGTLDKVFYTGSPVPVTFSEEGEDHGFWVYDTKTKALDFHALQSPKFITLTKENYKEYSKEDLKGNYVRAVGTTLDIPIITGLMYEDDAKDIGMLRIEAQKEYESEHRSDISAAMSYSETVTQYAKEQNFSDDAIAVGLDILNTVLS